MKFFLVHTVPAAAEQGGSISIYLLQQSRVGVKSTSIYVPAAAEQGGMK